jgi:2-iminobutanoate/2-iminopropanoate deaminase
MSLRLLVCGGRWQAGVARIQEDTGQLATHPDDDIRPIPDGIEAQTHNVMDNLTRALRGVGATLPDVVSVRAFLTAFERDYTAFNTIYAGYFPPDRLPARTTVGVTALARGGIIEIDMIARRAGWRIPPTGETT